jgi:NADH dehydrogenase
MAEFFSDYIWPLIIMVAESLLLLIVLLIAIAYVLYADRKIWAAVQLRRGPNVVGPWGLLQSFADLLKFCRRPLHLRHLVARRVRRDHGRLGVELEIPVPGGAALGDADRFLRSLDRLCHHHRAAHRGIAQSFAIVEDAARSHLSDLARRTVVDYPQLV